MNGSTELLLLRLGLIAVMFAFLAAIALSMRSAMAAEAAPRPRPVARRWRLVVVAPGESGLTRGAEFPLAGTMLIGRDARAGIVIQDGSVSTRHASIERGGAGWKVVDLGSTNGTLIDGRPIDQRGAMLHGGEQVTFGAVVLQILEG